MAALRRSSVIIYPKTNLTQLVFSRGFASKLLVKGLAFSTTEGMLANAFSQFGEVLEADVVRSKTNRSKGFGYVTFAKEEDAQEALMQMNGEVLDGRVIFVDNGGNNTRPRK